MKPIDVKNNNRVYIDEHNEKDITKSSSSERSRFKVGDRVRISKFKNIFAKGYTPKDLNDEEIIGSFYDRKLQKGIL